MRSFIKSSARVEDEKKKIFFSATIRAQHLHEVGSGVGGVCMYVNVDVEGTCSKLGDRARKRRLHLRNLLKCFRERVILSDASIKNVASEFNLAGERREKILR